MAARAATKTKEDATLFPAAEVIPPKKAAVAAKPKAPAKAKGSAVALHQPAKPRAVAKVPEAAPGNLLAVIARAAADPRVQPEKMRAMLDMQKEIMAEEARVAFIRAFIELQRDLPTINMTGRIIIEGKQGKKDQNTPYAKFNDINRGIKPLLAKHGFLLSFTTEPSPDGVRLVVKGYLDHVRGHGRSTAFPLPAETSGSKNNVQGWGSSMSYGKRYCTIALLNIISEAREDADRDGAAEDAEDRVPEKKRLTLVQSTGLTKLINESGVGLERFLQKYEIGAVIDLDPSLLAEATKACNDFAKAAAQKDAR